MTSTRNPLAICFGQALAHLRRKMGIEAEGLAHELGFSASAYRMIESGVVLLHPIYTLRLIKALPQLEFYPLATLLSALHVIHESRDNLVRMNTLLFEIGSADQGIDGLLTHYTTFIASLGKSPDASLIREKLSAGDYVDRTLKYLTEGPEQTKTADATATKLYQLVRDMIKTHPKLVAKLIS